MGICRMRSKKEKEVVARLPSHGLQTMIVAHCGVIGQRSGRTDTSGQDGHSTMSRNQMQSFAKALPRQPVQQKGEKLADSKVQVGQPGLDERVEMFGQQPEGVGLLEMVPPGGIRDTFQVLRWFLGQIGIRGSQRRRLVQRSLQWVRRLTGGRHLRLRRLGPV